MLESLKETEYDDELLDLLLEHARDGICSMPEVVDEDIVKRFTLCRRIRVREEKTAGWRSRQLDHPTERSVNDARPNIASMMPGGLSARSVGAGYEENVPPTTYRV